MASMRTLAVAWLALAFLAPAHARAERPADALLRLVPADAGATLMIEDLRGHAREVIDSPLAAGLGRLPAVQGWLDARGLGQLRKARADIEAALGVNLATLRDDLFGDAVVLALLPGAPGEAVPAHGLLLVRFRDRGLVDRLIATSNAMEKRSGSLEKVQARAWQGSGYSVRDFRPGTKPDEFYAILGDNILAWSNSEPLIQGAVARQAKGSSLGELDRFRAVRSALTERPLVSLFVDPRFLARAATQGASGPGKDDAVAAFLGRYYGAIDYAGAAIEWRDGPVLHVHELIDPARLDPELKRTVARSEPADRLLDRVPPEALALATAQFDPSALFDLVDRLIPEPERPRWRDLQVALRGMLLGRDLRREVLPAIGPAPVAFALAPDANGKEGRLPVALLLDIKDDAAALAAVENAARTMLALTALDKNRPGSPRLEVRAVDGVEVTSLTGVGLSPAFATRDGVFALGNSAEAVAAAFRPRSTTGEPTGFQKDRTRYFPAATSFAYVDAERVRRWAERHRGALASSLPGGGQGQEGADLDQVLGLLSLFRGAYLTSTVDAEFRSAHRVFGLIQRDDRAK